MTSLIDLFYGKEVNLSRAVSEPPVQASQGQPLSQASFKGFIERCFSVPGHPVVEFRQEVEKNEHHYFTVWSEVINAEVKVVCCHETATELVEQGVSRGEIYTKTELLELAKHPNPTPDYLIRLNRIKNQFKATLVHVEPVSGEGRVS